MTYSPRTLTLGLLLACAACSDRSITTESDDSTSGSSSSSTAADDTTTADPPTTGTPCITECLADLPSTDCDLLAQDCPAGEKCSSNGDDTFCAAVDPAPVAPGQPCTTTGPGVDNCAKGGLCWVDDVCHALCDADAPTCAQGQNCVNGDGLADICVASCDPLMQTCPMGQACVIPSTGVPVCAPDISGPGGEPGDVCEFVNGCDPGNQCDQKGLVPACAGQSCCAPFCDIAIPSSCPEGQDCVIFYAEGTAPAGLEFLGTCGAP